MEHQKLWERRLDCKFTKSTLARSDSKVTNTLLEIKVEDLRMLVGIMTLQPQQSSAQDLGHVGAIRITEEKVILNDAAPK